MFASHSLHVLSKLPVTILSPKGLLNAIAYTTFLCPSSVCSSSPVAVLHTLQVLSYDPVINIEPLLLKAQLVSGRTWALRTLSRTNSRRFRSCSFCFSTSFKISPRKCFLLFSVNKGSLCMICATRASTSVPGLKSNKSKVRWYCWPCCSYNNITPGG